MTEKQTIREEIKEHLRALAPEAWSAKSEKIRRLLLDSELFKRSRCVLAYVSVWNEVDTRRILQDCLELGKRLAVPRVIEGGNLEMREITDLTHDLAEGKFGIPEPVVSRTRMIERLSAFPEAACILVPGIAFDIEGRRLGRGLGYYDRFLEKLDRKVQRIGLAFDFQMIGHLPVLEHDQHMDAVLSA